MPEHSAQRVTATRADYSPRYPNVMPAWCTAVFFGSGIWASSCAVQTVKARLKESFH